MMFLACFLQVLRTRAIGVSATPGSLVQRRLDVLHDLNATARTAHKETLREEFQSPLTENNWPLLAD